MVSTDRLQARIKAKAARADVADKAKPGDTGVMLGMLSAIERDSRVTQRTLADELQIALGLTNAYLKRCAKKGFVKIRQAPLNRYAYYLTPRGFAEKSRLTAEYLSSSLDFFRQARHDCVATFEACRARGWSRIVLFGGGDLAEIALLSAGEAEIEVTSIVDPVRAPGWCAGRQMLATLAEAVAIAGGGRLDAVVVTDMAAPQKSFEDALAAAADCAIAEDRVVALNLLRVVRPAARASA